jgi:hypothetical protein
MEKKTSIEKIYTSFIEEKYTEMVRGIDSYGLCFWNDLGNWFGDEPQLSDIDIFPTYVDIADTYFKYKAH